MSFAWLNLTKPSQTTILATVIGFVAGGSLGSFVTLLWKRRKNRAVPSATTRQAAFLARLMKKVEENNSNCIYLDYNGTTPIYPEVLAAMLPYLTTYFGNPSSSHKYAEKPREAIFKARKQLLTLLGEEESDVSSIWFTSCGTDSDNLAVKLAFEANIKAYKNGKKPHVVTCNVEHPAIASLLDKLQTEGLIDVTYVKVHSDGRVAASDMIHAIQANTILVTLMLANNETGALQPVAAVARYCRNHGILFHTDAAQACGKINIKLKTALGDADMVTIVGHKMGACKGIACLYVRSGCLQESNRQLDEQGAVLVGGGQEFGRRGGTENVPYIVGLGKAAELATEHWRVNKEHMEALRSRLLYQLQDVIGDENICENGPTDADHRLPNTLSVGLRSVNSSTLLAAIGHKVAASAGATCHSTGCNVSSVLKAMKVPDEFARGTIRLSVGPTTTFAEVDRAAQIIASEAEKQVKMVAV